MTETAASTSFPIAHNYDRATVVATAVLQIVTAMTPDQLRPQLENYLRDEFADVAREVATDLNSSD